MPSTTDTRPVSTTTTTRKCHKCFRQESESIPLQQCSRCKETFYCSRSCQSTDWNSHKTTCNPQSYILKVHLCPGEITDPDVTRVLSCPANSTFYDFHRALQVAFGWANTHSYDFGVLDPDYDPERDFPSDIQDIIRIMQSGRDPNSKREFELRITDKDPGGFGFKVDKMHEKHRQHPRTAEKKADKVKLFQILDDPQYAGKGLEYMYDFGDGWKHVITVQGRDKPTTKFTCIDGTGHYVAEDVKRNGWGPLKAAYRASRPSKEQKENMHWFEYQASNADPEGLGGGREHHWNKEEINLLLLSMGL